jgi:tripartite-type tricarboxylate transporter receptor subunit TctC
MKLLKELLVASALLAAGTAPAIADAYPDRAVKLVLPFPAGSATDAVSRYMAEQLRNGLGQAVVVDNLPGADGIIAAQAVKRSPPDGYTLMVSTNSAHGTNRALYPKLPYDPEKDFEPVGALMRIPQLLVVRKDFPADDVAGLVRVIRERAASKPFSFGTGNTSSRIAGELLKQAANIDIANVPYRGTPQALQDLVGGQIDLFFADPYAAAALLDGGQIKVLAITDTTRLPQMPKVPTMAEAGYKSVEVVSWAGVFAPARTDPAIVERLNREINKVLATSQAQDYIRRMGAVPVTMKPAEFRAFVSSEIVRWGKLVDVAGIQKVQ